MIRPYRAVRAWLRKSGRHPARLIVVAYLSVIAAGTGLLMLPVATQSGRGTSFLDALFASTSSVCVTGLTIVDTPTYWAVPGQVILLVLIQVGGIGIMTVATLLGLLASRRMGLRSQLTAAMETKSLGIGDVRAVARGVLLISFAVESVVAIPLVLRFWLTYHDSLGHSVYSGVFHSVSAFNNAGTALFSDSLVGFVDDPVVIFPMAFAIIVGGLGFPVLLQVIRRTRGRVHWTLHTKITLVTSAVLLVVSTGLFTALEWSNAKTLRGMSAPDTLLAGFFHGAAARTAGFESVDVTHLRPATLLITMVLMFIGAGSASTAGGIKVTTFALLLMVIRAEIRADPDVQVMGRRVPAHVQRQALGVAMLSLFAVIVVTAILLLIGPFRLDDALFESVSAFSNTGLSTGVTPQLPEAGKALVALLMFAGRLGPVTFAAALALRARRRYYQYPEERPIIG